MSDIHAAISVDSLTKDEKSLILFLETQVVDHFGKVLSASMNKEDMKIVEAWSERGFIWFGRRPAKCLVNKPGLSSTNGRLHWVRFTSSAWDIAHQLRRERGERNQYNWEADEATG